MYVKDTDYNNNNTFYLYRTFYTWIAAQSASQTKKILKGMKRNRTIKYTNL